MTRARLGCRAVTAIMIVGMLMSWGCGRRVNMARSDDPDAVRPPAAAGTVEQLAGSSWLFESLDAIITFQNAPGLGGGRAVVLRNPRNPEQATAGTWMLRDNGVITVSTMGYTSAGTWDGQELVLGGKRGVRTDG